MTDTLDELEAIRARHEADEQAAEEGDGVPPLRLIAAHIDRGDLLRLLDAAREELREVREAAANIVTGMQLSEYQSLPDDRGFSTRLTSWRHEDDFTLGDLRRLAAALKEKP